MKEKFPVISKNGYEYLVRIDESKNMFDENVVRVSLFEVTQTIGFLGNQKEKLILLQESHYFDNDKEFFDYVLAVKNTVADYEKSSVFLKWENRESNIKQLEEWDGVCI